MARVRADVSPSMRMPARLREHADVRADANLSAQMRPYVRADINASARMHSYPRGWANGSVRT
jgi:hypothetical protein